MPQWVKCETIVKLRKTLSDWFGGGEDVVWLAAGTMIDEFVFYTVLIGQFVSFSKEVFTTVRCIKVSFFLYKRLVIIFNDLLFAILIYFYT